MDQKTKNTLSDFAVVNTHIFCFVPGKSGQITDQDKTDVVDCTLLAQLAASDSAKSVEKADAWMKTYTDTAASLGLTIQSGSTLKTASSEVIHISIDAVAVKLLRATEGAVETLPLRGLETLLYLKGKNSQGLDIIEENGRATNSGAFQLVVCEKLEFGDLLIRMSPYVFETTEPVTSAIFQPIGNPSTYTIKYMNAPTVAVCKTCNIARDSS
ncbi:hypothetical protein BDZ97DRAFT_1926216 [Flammula alnicola]|nr:hypothetical protein BDZ97DRAFT_1926216 [Flammula alnicola]